MLYFVELFIKRNYLRHHIKKKIEVTLFFLPVQKEHFICKLNIKNDYKVNYTFSDGSHISAVVFIN